MRVRKAIKKVAAIGVGASMLGATLVGAAAANLGNYPDMLITGGSFDGVIVLGDNAIASDTLGAVDIATGLTVSGSSGSSSTSGVTIAGGSVIRTSGNELNINEALSDVESTLDESEIPQVLADGLFDDTEGENDNEEIYTQEIELVGTNQAELILYQDKKDADMGGLYIFLDDSENLYNYTLEFDDSIEYDNETDATAEDDFETTKIDIQGNTYTIVGVKLDNSGELEELQLQAGDTTIWLEQSQPVTRVIGGEEHEIELVDVNEKEDKCGVTVDGTLQWVDVGQTKRINGVEVGVTDAITVHSEAQDTDVCELNLGAQEIILEENKEVRINGKDIDGSTVNLDVTGDQWDGFNILYKPDEDVYMAVGDVWQDPVLGNFEISFESIVANYEEIDFDVSGEDLTVTFLNIDGKEIELPFFCGGDCNDASDDITFGTDAGAGNEDEVYYLAGQTCTGTNSLTDCEGARFLVEQGDEVHVIEVSDIDLSDDEITLDDITYGGSKTSDINDGALENYDLPAGGDSAELTITEAAKTIVFNGGSGDEIVGYGEPMLTKYEHEFSIVNATNADNSTKPDFILNENEAEGDSDDSFDSVNVSVSVDIADEEIDVDAPYMGANEATTSPVEVSDADDENTIAYSGFGTRAEHDSEEDRSLTLFAPDYELYANVFVGPTGADVRIATGAAAAVQVGAAKLASEVSDLSAQNTIIVGGPCANAAAAEFLGVSQANCSEGAPQENTAEIVAKDMDGVVSILVNGYDALDTRRAARVLYNYNDYPLAGEKVVVSGASLSDISVSAAQ